jgi:hypothetical protein
VGFVVDKGTLGQIFILVFLLRFVLLIIILQVLHNYSPPFVDFLDSCRGME